MKLRLFLLLLLQGLISLAQPPKETFKPDHIIDRFFAVKDGSLYCEAKQENGSLKYGRAADSPRALAALYNIPEETIVPVVSLRKITAEEMLKELQDVQMDYPWQERAAQYHVVNFLPNGLAIMSNLSTSSSGYVNTVFYKLEPEMIADYTVLNLYKDGNFSGRIYPLKEGYKLRMFYGFGNSSPVVVKVRDREALQKLVRRNYPATEIFTENKRYGVRFQEGKKTVIIPAVHDSISLACASMVTIHMGKKIKLFYRTGEPVPANIRAIQLNSNSYSGVLVGNTTFYLFTDGSLLEKLPDMRMEGCGTIPHYTDSIVKQGGYYKHRHMYDYGERRLTETVIAKVSDLKEVKLLNNSTISYGLTTGFYSPYNTGRKGYIVTLNSGAKSIIEIKKDGSYKLSLEPDNYTFTSKEYEMNPPLRFKSNGLHGFWPQNDSARYKELSDFDKGFARYILPDGTKGWLSFDGVEYRDE